MKKPIKKLDLNLYYEKLDNGLELYIIPKNNVNNIFVTLSTKYGSVNETFVPINSKKMITVPKGIAHFLEHKMFEQQDGIDPFTFYNEKGADCNANTSNYKTTYLFAGSTSLKENLNYLIDYVQNPYFTDANVEKEKGIIEQEIKMYQDDPFTVLYEEILKNSFIKHPIKDPIIGSLSSVRSITKEDLYNCYNTFYHPNNMFLVITGNVNQEEVIKIVKENQKNKTYSLLNKIKQKKYDEPDNVLKKITNIKLPVESSKVAISYKINFSKIKGISRRKITFYLTILFESKCGETSLLNESLKEKGIIADDLDIEFVDTDKHMLFVILAETEKSKDLIDSIDKELCNLKLNKEDLNRKIKNLLSSYLYMSDNIFHINEKIMDDIIKYKKVSYNEYNQIKGLNIEEFNKLINQISLENKNIVSVSNK